MLQAETLERVGVWQKQPVIAMCDVSRHFQTGDTVVKALDKVSLTINDGEFVAIMGQSGSGKSTLMNILGCLDRASSGDYAISGKYVPSLNPDELASLRRINFGFIFQRYNLLANASAAENVEIPALYAGIGKQQRHERALKLLGDLNIADRHDHRPSELSGGQQQRVAIARALMNDPAVILADEPTGALDTQSGQEVMALLKQLNEQGRTVILITHDEKVAAHANRLIRLQDGRIVEDTGADSLAQRNVDNNDLLLGATNISTGQDLSDESSLPDKQPSMEQETNQPVNQLTVSSIEAIKMALRSLRVNFFRTALTLLGIVIGVAAVVTMMAVGNGSKENVMDQISAMGTNLLDIRPSNDPGFRGSGDRTSLMPSDAKALVDIPNISSIVPTRSGNKTLRIDNIDTSSNVQGVGEDFPAARDWAVLQGTFFTSDDVDTYAAVAVLGSTVAETFFADGQDPVGEFMILGKIPFQIIGVMESKGASAFGGDQDDTVIIPYTTGLVRLFGSNYINSITVKVEDTELIDQTEQQITTLLLDRHGTEDFSVRNTASFLEMATATQDTLTILLGAVAAISLLVGGIGVMNIMLVSVVERTREIGIRMATGARMRDILIQFNTESAVVCTIGGILGVLLGFATGLILRLFQVDILFSALPAILAFSCAVITGVLFGYLPASKAAKLDPVVALSSE